MGGWRWWGLLAIAYLLGAELWLGAMLPLSVRLPAAFGASCALCAGVLSEAPGQRQRASTAAFVLALACFHTAWTSSKWLFAPGFVLVFAGALLIPEAEWRRPIPLRRAAASAAEPRAGADAPRRPA